ncbi:MAG TPA: hypothetical protein VIJ96_19075 [Acidothermaceae bacterium]
MSRTLDRAASHQLRSLLFLSGIFAADGVVAGLAFHNTLGATLAGTYLVGIAVAGPVLMWRRKI